MSGAGEGGEGGGVAVIVESSARHSTVFGVVDADGDDVAWRRKGSTAQHDVDIVDGGRGLIVASQIVVPQEDQEVVAGCGDVEGTREVLPGGTLVQVALAVEGDASFGHFDVVEAAEVARSKDHVGRYNGGTKVVVVHLPIAFPIEAVEVVAYGVETEGMGGEDRGGLTAIVVVDTIVANVERTSRMPRCFAYYPAVVLVAAREGPSVGVVVVVEPSRERQRMRRRVECGGGEMACDDGVETVGVDVDVVDGAGGESRQGE